MAGTEVLMAGFGGQGMLLSGKILAYAAMYKGLEVSWLPSYGPEMRGGTANVTVVISDKQVASPYIVQPRALLVMNQPSLEKFAPRVKPGGVIVVNTSLVSVKCDRDDCNVVYVDASGLAAAAGSARSGNIVMLGTYVAMADVVDSAAVEKMIEKEFGSKPKLVPGTIAAFRAGYEAGRKAKEPKAIG